MVVRRSVCGRSECLKTYLFEIADVVPSLLRVPDVDYCWIRAEKCVAKPCPAASWKPASELDDIIMRHVRCSKHVLGAGQFPSRHSYPADIMTHKMPTRAISVAFETNINSQIKMTNVNCTSTSKNMVDVIESRHQ